MYSAPPFLMSELHEYSDGHPLDDIRYLEYKILLKPDRFARPEGYEYYWEAITKTAKKVGVKIKESKDPFKRTVRAVMFYDTHKFDLYNNRFILRKRTYYVDGWPEVDHELAFKFRSEDKEKAAATDVRPQIPGKDRIKFKEEILPLRDRVGGMRSLYSHNCVLTSPNIILTHGLSNVTEVFPCLADIDVSPETRLDLVNQMRVSEVQVEPGKLDFGHDLKAKATIAIWRNRATESSMVGEFAYQVQVDSSSNIDQKARKLADDFFMAVQEEAPSWVQIGTTKTCMVYGLGNQTISNQE